MEFEDTGCTGFRVQALGSPTTKALAFLRDASPPQPPGPRRGSCLKLRARTRNLDFVRGLCHKSAAGEIQSYCLFLGGFQGGFAEDCTLEKALPAK